MSERTFTACRFVAQRTSGMEFSIAGFRLLITFLDTDILRVRYTAEKKFTARRSWDTALDDNAFTPLSPNMIDDGTAYVLDAGGIRVMVHKDDGRLAFRDVAGHEFAADAAPLHRDTLSLGKTRITCPDGDTLPEGAASTEWRLRKRMHPRELYLGFGERSGLLDRRGRVISNWTIDPPFGHGRAHDNLYQAHPTFMALHDGFAWGCFVHASWHTQFDVGLRDPNVLDMHIQGGECDYYLFTGPTPAAVVEQLTRLTGRPCLPPLWALGYHQSRWSYMTEAEVLEIAAEFRAREIPLDVLHLDIDYMDGFRVFSFDPQRFPTVKTMTESLRAQGIRTVTIVDPGVKDDLYSGYKVARDGVNKGVFLQNTDGTLFTGCVWPGRSFFPDFADANARAWWGTQHRFLLDHGIDGVWNDMNEPAIFTMHFKEPYPIPLATPQGRGKERTVHAEVHNLFGLLMGRASYQGLLALRPQERPWILTRSGFTGIQQYAAAWMGDNHSWWEHLELSLPQLMSMGLSGVPHVGVDIGGFADNCHAELYARWIQMGVFYPFMRTHTCGGSMRQEPWSFGDAVTDIAREAIQLRYRLLPYLYTLAHCAHRDGMPILRPLLYDFPADTTTYHLHDQLMFGPSLLIAPIVHPGRDHRAVYLPAGRWFDFWNGEAIDGGRWIVSEAPLTRIPVYVRGGAVLPLGNVRASTDIPISNLTLAAYLGDGESKLIEDDGISFAYRQGTIAETTMLISELSQGARVQLHARRGDYIPAPRTITLSLYTGQTILPNALAVTVNGAPCGDWEYAGGMISLHWSDDGAARDIDFCW